MAARLERDARAPLPQWFLDEPVPDDGTKLVVAAFWELSTERSIGWVPGQIPQSRIEAYGVKKGLPDAIMGLFSAAVRACDDSYLEWISKRRASSAEKQEPTK